MTRLITAARASRIRVPLLVSRCTSKLEEARNSVTAEAAASAGTPGQITSHSEASI
jgi:hypothetical protein